MDAVDKIVVERFLEAYGQMFKMGMEKRGYPLRLGVQQNDLVDALRTGGYSASIAHDYGDAYAHMSVMGVDEGTIFVGTAETLVGFVRYYGNHVKIESTDAEKLKVAMKDLLL